MFAWGHKTLFFSLPHPRRNSFTPGHLWWGIKTTLSSFRQKFQNPTSHPCKTKNSQSGFGGPVVVAFHRRGFLAWLILLGLALAQTFSNKSVSHTHGYDAFSTAITPKHFWARRARPIRSSKTRGIPQTWTVLLNNRQFSRLQSLWAHFFL